MAIEAQEYFDLAKACINDDFDGVKAVLEKFPNIDLNVGRNGTPLIDVSTPYHTNQSNL